MDNGDSYIFDQLEQVRREQKGLETAKVNVVYQCLREKMHRRPAFAGRDHTRSEGRGRDWVEYDLEACFSGDSGVDLDARNLLYYRDLRQRWTSERSPRGKPYMRFTYSE